MRTVIALIKFGKSFLCSYILTPHRGFQASCCIETHDALFGSGVGMTGDTYRYNYYNYNIHIYILMLPIFEENI